MSGGSILARVRAQLPKGVRRGARSAIEYSAICRRLLANYRYDFQRFLRASGVDGRFGSDGKLRALIYVDLHRLEKGLALAAPVPGFGMGVARRLLDSLEVYAAVQGGVDTVRLALNVLNAYRRFQEGCGQGDVALWARIDRLAAQIELGDFSGGGVIPVRREDILARSQRDLESFFESRHSIRQFSAREVDASLIERAVRMAQRTPSVCNRQASRVHVYTDPSDRARMLACQRGSRGFGDQVQVVLAVTVDLETFISVGERNQAWIDGGMFAMTLIWALHSLGLGTCALNWSAELERDEDVHAVGGIPESEVVIMMIAVGHLPDTLHVAQSVRRPLHEVLKLGTTRAASKPGDP